jgi:hypothetical protein
MRGLWTPILLVLLLALPTPSSAADDVSAARRVLVTDGSAVHDLGNTHLNITNWGLIGSRPGIETGYSAAPSLRYQGVDHLWAAGLWVGGVVDGESRVSTGQYLPELLPDPDDPLDIIYESGKKPSGKRRYPAPNADDDRDGLEDEDPLDGRDNDQDGLVDEDYASIGEQYFRAVQRDDTQLADELFPDHEPLGLEVVQESFQFKNKDYDDIVGFRFTITNVGDSTIEQPCIGMFADFDIGLASNDLAQTHFGPATALDGSTVNLTMGYAYSANLNEGAYSGILMASPDGGASTLQIYSGNDPFDRGGDPTNDAERYQALSSGIVDVPSGVPNDVRLLISAGPLSAALAPGETIAVDFAFVVGASEEDLVANAASAAKLARGAWFDRDGDPSTGLDGREFHVPWYEAKGKASRGRAPQLKLSATPTPFNPRVQLSYELPVSGPSRIDAYDVRGRHVVTVLDRDLSAGPGQVVWNGTDARGRSVGSGVYFFRLQQAARTETTRAVIVR